MGVNLSVKNVPAEQVELLKQRAKRNHRSLQGELLAIIEKVTAPKSIEELSDYVQTLDLTRKKEAVRMIREDRDR
ncbi:MAG TPA: Arc family DNA-binding protein [Rhizomicrobium sp.]